VTRQWLEFDDVTLDLPHSDARAGRFSLRPRREIRLLEHDAMPWTGRFEFHGNLVVTGMALGTPRPRPARERDSLSPRINRSWPTNRPISVTHLLRCPRSGRLSPDTADKRALGDRRVAASLIPCIPRNFEKEF
jgi:hypothetical protein